MSADVASLLFVFVLTAANQTQASNPHGLVPWVAFSEWQQPATEIFVEEASLGSGRVVFWARLLQPSGALWAQSSTCPAIEVALAKLEGEPLVYFARPGAPNAQTPRPAPARPFIPGPTQTRVWGRALQADGVSFEFHTVAGGGRLAEWARETSASLRECWYRAD